MQAQPAGSMLAVRMPFDEVKDLLTAQLSIAAINSPVLTVVSGSDDAISELEGRLQHLEKPASRLHTSHAFHSAMMKPMLSDYRACFSGVHLSKPTIPFISNITGTWITPEQAQNPEYWVEHVMAAVAFAGGISTLFEDEQRTLLEVGPGNSLFTLALQNAGGKQRQVYSISGHVKSGISQTENLIVTLGKLWEGGASVNWDTFHQNVCRRHVHLPTYPFERNRHWVEPVNVYGREKGI
jgi:acyl transferase domain-containing protein